MNEIKKQLHNLCLNYVQERMNASQQAINEAQQATNDDTKSSAGDKYETGREMMQQETNRNLTQLNEANKLLIALNQISTAEKSETAEPGSLVITNNGHFYLAISAGTITLNGQNYFAISPASPIGLKMKGCRAGERFSLNSRTYNILEVW
jgi:transcription elongation GreA/GreB family factor